MIETATPVVRYTIAGIGPYTIGFPYFAGGIVAARELAGVSTALAPADFSIAPLVASPSGVLYLTLGFATANAGAALVIKRVTPDEQGWVAVLGERERGLEVQMDRGIMAAQELRAALAGALRYAGGTVADFVPQEDKVVLWQGGKFVAGPTAAEIAAAQAQATIAVNSAAAAVVSKDAAAVFAAAAAASAPLPSTTGHGGKPLRANANGVGVEFAGIFATTATAAGTTTLVAGSADNQHFTGVLAQTLVLPVVSTLAQGRVFLVINESTGAIAIQSSGLNAIASVPAKTVMRLACKLITGTDAASWAANLAGFDTTPALIRGQLGLVIGVNVEAFGGGAALSRVSPLIWKPVPESNTGTFVGFRNLVFVGAGATSAAIAVTNRFTYAARYEALVTVAAIAAVAGFRMNEVFVTVGGPAGLGGFRFIGRWGPATGVATTTNRAFFGMSATIVAPTDVQPSSLLSSVFMGWDAADTNIQIMHNDGAGACTKIDLGASFPVPLVDRTSLYELELTSPAGVTQSVTYLVTDLISGATATGTVTTNLPAVATLLTPHGYVSAGGTSSVIGMALYSLYLDPLV